MSRSGYPTQTLSPVYIFFGGLVAIGLGLLAIGTIFQLDPTFIHGAPRALPTASLQKEPPCVKRLLIKRVDDGHLVTGDDVSYAKKVCEQAAALGAAK